MDFTPITIIVIILLIGQLIYFIYLYTKRDFYNEYSIEYANRVSLEEQLKVINKDNDKLNKLVKERDETIKVLTEKELTLIRRLYKIEAILEAHNLNNPRFNGVQISEIKSKLRNKISETDLLTIAMDIGANKDEFYIPNGTLNQNIIAFLDYCIKHNLLLELKGWMNSHEEEYKW